MLYSQYISSKYKHIPLSFLVVGSVCVCYESIELYRSKINITSHARIEFKPHQVVSIGIHSQNLFQRYMYILLY